MIYLLTMNKFLFKTVKTEFKIKSGETFKVGEQAIIGWQDDSGYATVKINGKTMKLNSALLYKKFAGFTKPPSLKTMEKWASDGISKTVLGYKTEMDGVGKYNDPSWMKLMGLI